MQKLSPKETYLSPPMGWNSWDCFGASVTEDEVLANAQVLKDKLYPFGWDTVVVDIQWYEGTADGWNYHAFTELTLDSYGRPMPDPRRFPSAADGRGFKPLADKIHAMGLKFGLHMMRGIPRQAVHQDLPIYDSDYSCREAASTFSICAWNTDMYGVNTQHPAAEAWYNSLYQLFASWDVDYVKVDDIAWNKLEEDHYPQAEVELIAKAISHNQRPMVLSLSPGPAVLNYGGHMSRFANLWRITDDLWDEWELVARCIDRCQAWAPFVGVNASWPDADMLPLGRLRCRPNPQGEACRLSQDEQTTLFRLWCLFRSPLMMGGDLQQLDDWTLSLLTDKELLKLNQTPYRKPRCLIYKKDEVCLWEQVDREEQRCALLAINLSDEERSFDFAAFNEKVIQLKPHASLLHIEGDSQ